MHVDLEKIQIVPLEDELKGASPASAEPKKVVSRKGKTPTSTATLGIEDQSHERNWLVIMVFAVFAAFMMTFLGILSFQLVKLGDVDKTLQVFTTVSAVVFAVVNPIIAFYFGKQMKK